MEQKITEKLDLFKKSYIEYDRVIETKQNELNSLKLQQQRVSDQIEVLEELLN